MSRTIIFKIIFILAGLNFFNSSLCKYSFFAVESFTGQNSMGRRPFVGSTVKAARSSHKRRTI